MILIQDYLDRVEKIRKTGAATEVSYRSTLEFLFGSLSKNIQALNEPKRVAVGAPDFIINRGDIVIGHVEAKDINIDIHSFKGSNKEQQERYLKGLPNLIYTNCLDFDFFRDGKLLVSISIGTNQAGIKPILKNFEPFENLLRDFVDQRPQTITSPRILAEKMAGKAGLIKDILSKTLFDDKDQHSELASQFGAFKEHLIHDITIDDFSDIYAETIAYGLFAARLHDTNLDTFSRTEALELLPKSNPFLRNLFGYIAGPNLDDRIRWIIDDLSDVFQACDVRRLMQGFGRLTGRDDPFIHFYETFLAAYNPNKRKARGVWYTPEPVVNFSVRAVDNVIQKEFGLEDGLGDISKITVDWDTGQRQLTKKGQFAKSGKNTIEKKEVHRVQILDPATGTGTFLAEIIKQISPKVKDVAEGMWSKYIENDLIPRLHGFELLMASYAMCHMKIDMILTELGYKPTGTPPRLSVYLTNSLEEGEPANQTLPFAQWLSNEVKQANSIKRDMPIMCIVGNPPYSGISQNMGEWIVGLIDEYKYVDGKHFGERKHWLHDDYVKFIRLSEYLIDKNGEGVLGFITNHGYLSNPTFRGMRQHLMKTFDKIYVIDLHGNANKQEVSPDGSPDKNIFDIRQGVAIMIAVKKSGLPSTECEVYHTEIWGDRSSKNAKIWSLDLDYKNFIKLKPRSPYYMFYNVNNNALDKYDIGFSISKFFPVHSTGIISARDDLTVDFEKSALSHKMKDFLDPNIDNEQVRLKFFGPNKGGKYLPGDSRGWRLSEKRPLLQKKLTDSAIKSILYRPFDSRWIVYDSDIVDWPRLDTMGTFSENKNIALLSPRMTADPFSPLVTNQIISNKTASRYDQSYFFPLYIYPGENELSQNKIINIDPKLFKKLQNIAKNSTKGEPQEQDMFDYVYGVLHAPKYRQTYVEFLSIDFPRIPWPSSSEEFWDISAKGSILRSLHLSDPAVIGATPFQFRGNGDNIVRYVDFDEGKVWINPNQYFDNVSEVAWNMYVGGYQPCQYWLKKRKNRELNFDDVKQYQRIIKISTETDRIMKLITITL